MNNSKKCLSVLICTNNRRRQLEECVSVIEKQHLWVNEIIIIDSSEIPIGYKKIANSCKNTRLRYFTTKIKSIPYSRNILLKKAKNNLCMFVDDDVILNKNAISNCVLFFKKNPGAAMVGGVGHPKNKTNIYSHYFYKTIFYQALESRRNVITASYCPTMICGFQKKIFLKHKICFDEEILNLEDVDLCLSLKKFGENIYIDKKISGIHNYRTNCISFYSGFYNYYLYAKKIYLKHNVDFFGVKSLLGEDFYLKAFKYIYDKNDKYLYNFSKNKLENLWLCSLRRLAMVNANKK